MSSQNSSQAKNLSPRQSTPIQREAYTTTICDYDVIALDDKEDLQNSPKYQSQPLQRAQLQRSAQLATMSSTNHKFNTGIFSSNDNGLTTSKNSTNNGFSNNIGSNSPNITNNTSCTVKNSTTINDNNISPDHTAPPGQYADTLHSQNITLQVEVDKLRFKNQCLSNELVDLRKVIADYQIQLTVRDNEVTKLTNTLEQCNRQLQQQPSQDDLEERCSTLQKQVQASDNRLAMVTIDHESQQTQWKSERNSHLLDQENWDTTRSNYDEKILKLTQQNEQLYRENQRLLEDGDRLNRSNSKPHHGSNNISTTTTNGNKTLTTTTTLTKLLDGETDEWACSLCTMLNPLANTKCITCEACKPIVYGQNKTIFGNNISFDSNSNKSNMSRASSNGSYSTSSRDSPTITQKETVKTSDKPAQVNSTLTNPYSNTSTTPPPPTPTRSWTCKKCTTLNSGDVVYCTSCGVECWQDEEKNIGEEPLEKSRRSTGDTPYNQQQTYNGNNQQYRPKLPQISQSPNGQHYYYQNEQAHPQQRSPPKSSFPGPNS